MSDLRALDLFRGAGGWSVGARMVGIEDDGVEIMPEANATAEAAGFTTVGGDVWTTPLPTRTYVGQIASPPCQSFSMAGHGAGRKALADVLELVFAVELLPRIALRDVALSLGDERTGLVLSPLWYALHVGGAEWLAWEQVPAVLPVWEACAAVLAEHGWHTWTGYVFSEQYGVPQTRKRAVLLASRRHAVNRPRPTHSAYYPRDPTRLDPGVRPWVSMATALGFDKDDTVVSNYGSGGNPANRGVRTGAQPSASVTSKVDRDLVYRNGSRANAARRGVDTPAPTVMFGQRLNDVRWVLTSGTRPGSARRPMSAPAMTLALGHDAASYTVAPDMDSTQLPKAKADGRARRVTVEEAGVLQSFPVDHPWQGNQSKRYLQVGNAVPPLMAAACLIEAAYGVI